MTTTLVSPAYQPAGQVENITDATKLITEAKLRSLKIKTYTEGLVIKAKEGVNAELDDILQATIVKFNTALKDMNDKRMPITRQLDAIKKEFTTQENEVTACIALLQPYRDNYVKKVREDAERQRKEALHEQYRKQELIDIRAEAGIAFTSFVVEIITKTKNSMIVALKSVTDENREKKFNGLQRMPTQLDVKIFESFRYAGVSKFGHNVAAIVDEVVHERTDAMLKRYDDQIREYKSECILFLQNVITADHVETMQKEVQVEAQQIIEASTAMATVLAGEAKVDAAFNDIVIADEMPESREGYAIEIKAASGYAAIAAFWFATFAKDLTIDKFGTKTINSMVKDCENHAHKTGQKIESVNVIYSVRYKAVNRK